jgi:hypothetical protein
VDKDRVQRYAVVRRVKSFLDANKEFPNQLKNCVRLGKDPWT